jgi:hypothetical protein
VKWPTKSETRLGSGQREDLTIARRCYRQLIVSQVRFPSWQLEAARLFSEYWRTADERHLRAFNTHVAAMRSYLGRVAQ